MRIRDWFDNIRDELDRAKCFLDDAFGDARAFRCHEIFARDSGARADWGATVVAKIEDILDEVVLLLDVLDRQERALVGKEASHE